VTAIEPVGGAAILDEQLSVAPGPQLSAAQWPEDAVPSVDDLARTEPVGAAQPGVMPVTGVLQVAAASGIERVGLSCDCKGLYPK
jgi:hypothetical protein